MQTAAPPLSAVPLSRRAGTQRQRRPTAVAASTLGALQRQHHTPGAYPCTQLAGGRPERDAPERVHQPGRRGMRRHRAGELAVRAALARGPCQKRMWHPARHQADAAAVCPPQLPHLRRPGGHHPGVGGQPHGPHLPVRAPLLVCPPTKARRFQAPTPGQGVSHAADPPLDVAPPPRSLSTNALQGSVPSSLSNLVALTQL